jgi:hypothetical protein
VFRFSHRTLIRTAHVIGRTQRWQCDLCPRSYTTSGNLTRSHLPTYLPALSCLVWSGLAWSGLLRSLWCGVAFSPKIVDSIVVSILACHARDPGSNLDVDVFFFVAKTVQELTDGFD